MAPDSDKPKFLEELILDKTEVTRPVSRGSPDEIINIRAKIYTGGGKFPVDFIIIHPDNEEEKLIQRKPGEEGRWIAEINMPYRIYHDIEPGKYYVIAKIRARCDNEDDCKRKNFFIVK